MELETVLTSLAQSLRDERLRAGLTLEQLAQKADLSTAHLSRLESGDRQPSVAALISLARALGAPLSRLLGEHHQGAAISIYPPDEPTHEANGLTISGVSGFPGSSTLEALHITIDPEHHRAKREVRQIWDQVRLFPYMFMAWILVGAGWLYVVSRRSPGVLNEIEADFERVTELKEEMIEVFEHTHVHPHEHQEQQVLA